MTGSFPHSVPFTDRGSTGHPQIIYHRFLGLSCCCLHFHSGQILTPRVVYVIGVVVPASCNVTMCHRQWLDSLGNFPYPGGYCSSINNKFLSIIKNRLKWVGTQPETSWCRCNHQYLHSSCWVKLVSWSYIFLAQILKWVTQTSGSRLWWVCLALDVGRKCTSRK